MPDTNMVPVTFTVDPETAAALDNPAVHARIQQLIQRSARPAKVERLFEVMDALSDEARRRGMTDEILEAELEAYNSERRTAATST